MSQSFSDIPKCCFRPGTARAPNRFIIISNKRANRNEIKKEKEKKNDKNSIIKYTVQIDLCIFYHIKQLSNLCLWYKKFIKIYFNHGVSYGEAYTVLKSCQLRIKVCRCTSSACCTTFTYFVSCLFLARFCQRRRQAILFLFLLGYRFQR